MTQRFTLSILSLNVLNTSFPEDRQRETVSREFLFHFIVILFIGQMGRLFANTPGDLASIPGRVIPKTLKMVLDTSLLNPQQYKVRIKGKVEQSRERSIAFPYTLV